MTHMKTLQERLTFSKHNYFNIAQHFQYRNGEKKTNHEYVQLDVAREKNVNVCVGLSTRNRAARSPLSNEVFVIVN